MNNYRKAAVMYGIDDIRVENIALVEPGADDVLVNIKSVSICGSDITYYKKGRSVVAEVVPPHILGHESAGQIVKVGENVTNLKVGDRVAIEPGKPCGKCELCLSGRYNLCHDMAFMSTPRADKSSEGAFVEYSVRPAKFVFAIPDNVSYNDAALAEPLSVALQALKRGKVTAGQSVAIFGCGPIALSILLAVKAYGCSEIFMTDVIDYRLKKAKELGAKEVFDGIKDDYVNAIDKLTNHRGVDVVIDTTSSQKAIEAATSIVTRGGTIVLLGAGTNGSAVFNTQDMLRKELCIASVFRYNNMYPKAINLIGSGLVDMKKLVTHIMPLEKISEAMEIASERKENVIKIMINI